MPAPSSPQSSPTPKDSRGVVVTPIFVIAVAWCLLAFLKSPAIESPALSIVVRTLWPTPPKALAVGIALALLAWVSPGKRSKDASKLLLQSCIVLSGFTMNAAEVIKAGATGIVFTIATIAGSFGLGWLLWKWLGTDGKVTTLLSSGTAICGGSAIAAVSPVIGASSAQISVAMATVFMLNAVALYVFPPLGEHLGMTATQFGTWAGIAIHDTSSVYGAGQVFDARHPGGDALQQAMAVKLSRALWIAPIVFIAAWWVRRAARQSGDRAAKSSFPWFIVWFVGACVVRTLVPALADYKDQIRHAAGAGMTLALLLIGMGLSRAALRTVGFKPMLQGVLMWLALGVSALAAVRGLG
jgi:uncharacterized integral membrane protein (TIGR00698 family)